MTVSIELTTITCSSCGGVYALSATYHEEARKKGGFQQCWTCPYCKSQRGYGQGEADELRAEIARLKETGKWLEARKLDAQREAEHFRKSRDGIKGVLARERKRVGNGVCPCCNRAFTNLQRHMATKHPEHKSAPPKEPNS